MIFQAPKMTETTRHGPAFDPLKKLERPDRGVWRFLTSSFLLAQASVLDAILRDAASGTPLVAEEDSPKSAEGHFGPIGSSDPDPTHPIRTAGEVDSPDDERAGFIAAPPHTGLSDFHPDHSDGSARSGWIAREIAIGDAGGGGGGGDGGGADFGGLEGASADFDIGLESAVSFDQGAETRVAIGSGIPVFGPMGLDPLHAFGPDPLQADIAAAAVLKAGGAGVDIGLGITVSLGPIGSDPLHAFGPDPLQADVAAAAVLKAGGAGVDIGLGITVSLGPIGSDPLHAFGPDPLQVDIGAAAVLNGAGASVESLAPIGPDVSLGLQQDTVLSLHQLAAMPLGTLEAIKTSLDTLMPTTTISDGALSMNGVAGNLTGALSAQEGLLSNSHSQPMSWSASVDFISLQNGEIPSGATIGLAVAPTTQGGSPDQLFSGGHYTDYGLALHSTQNSSAVPIIGTIGYMGDSSGTALAGNHLAQHEPQSAGSIDQHDIAAPLSPPPVLHDEFTVRAVSI
jgi:hypothetical protein